MIGARPAVSRMRSACLLATQSRSTSASFWSAVGSALRPRVLSPAVKHVRGAQSVSWWFSINASCFLMLGIVPCRAFTA